MNLTFAANLTKMIDAGLGREAAPPETFVAVGRTTEYTDLGPVPIASFETNVEAPLRALSVALEPIQDLHGQSNPYPAGGGKNLFQTTATTQTINGKTFTVADDGSVTATGTATASIDSFVLGDTELPAGTYKVNGLSNGGSAAGRLSVYNNTSGSEITTIYNNRDVEFTLADPATVRIVFIILSGDSETYTAYPMIRKSTETDATFAPYSNICPISGRNSVTVTRAGKNLLTRTGETHAYLDSTGNIREYASGWLLSDYIRVAPSTQYTFNPNSTAGGSAKSWYFDANKNGISYIDSGESTFTTPDNCSFMRFSYREASTNVQLELGSIATPYEPYNGQTVTLQLGQTVYSGTVDVTTGEIVVDRAIATFDGTENWIMGVISYVKSDATDIYLNKSDMLRVNIWNTPMYGNCNQLAAAGTSIWSSDGHANEFVFNLIQIHINIANNLVGITDPAQETIDTARDKVKAWLAAQYANGTPVTITYPLATPLTVQLTAQQITTLLGQNNVWSDGGDVSLTYGTTRYTEGY